MFLVMGIVIKYVSVPWKAITTPLLIRDAFFIIFLYLDRIFYKFFAYFLFYFKEM